MFDIMRRRNTTMKTTRKFLSSIIVLTVFLSFSAVPAFAETTADDSSLHLLCFGDSTSNGFALEGYSENGTSDRLDDYSNVKYGHGGFHDLSNKSCIALLRDKYTDESHFENLCFEAQNPTIVRAFINENYAAKVLKYEIRNNPDYNSYLSYQLFNTSPARKYHPYKVFNDTTTKTPIDKSGKIYKRYYEKHPGMVQRYANLNFYFTESVKKADVIVLDGVMSSLFNYPSNAIIDLVDNDMDAIYKNTILDITSLPESLKKNIRNFSNKLTDQLDELGLPASKLKIIKNVFEYSYAIACIDTVKAVQEIHNLNPDAEVVIVGPSNILKDLHINYEGVNINVGGLFNVIVNGTSSYLKKNAISCDYTYAGFSKNYQTILKELEETKTPEKLLKDDPYLAEQILCSLKDAAKEAELESLSAALDPDSENIEAQITALKVTIDSSHFKSGYNLESIIDVYSDSGELEALTDLNDVIFNGKEVSEELDAIAFLNVLANISKGAGVHPSVQGSIEKYDVISKKIDTLKKDGETLSKAYLAKAKALYLTAKAVRTSKTIKNTLSKITNLRDKLSHMKTYEKLSQTTTEKNIETIKYLNKAEDILKNKTK